MRRDFHVGGTEVLESLESRGVVRPAAPLASSQICCFDWLNGNREMTLIQTIYGPVHWASWVNCKYKHPFMTKVYLV